MIINKATSENIGIVTKFLAEQSFNLFWDLRKEEFKNGYSEYVKKYFVDGYIEEYMEIERTIFYATNNNEIIGAGCIDSENYLTSLYVKEEYRNKGIGTAIMKEIIKNSSKDALITMHASIKAISLYNRLGFTKIDEKNDENYVLLKLERDNYEK